MATDQLMEWGEFLVTGNKNSPWDRPGTLISAVPGAPFAPPFNRKVKMLWINFPHGEIILERLLTVGKCLLPFNTETCVFLSTASVVQ
jgi:hypothetical protein